MAYRRDNILTGYAIGLFFLAVIGYALFEARWLILGPTIAISSDTSATSTQFIIIRGSAQHSSTLLFNGAPVAVTENGTFGEGFVLIPGVNELYFDATDRYGHSVHKVVTIVYTATTSATLTTSATTTTHSFLTLPPSPTTTASSTKNASSTKIQLATTTKSTKTHASMIPERII